MMTALTLKMICQDEAAVIFNTKIITQTFWLIQIQIVKNIQDV